MKSEPIYASAIYARVSTADQADKGYSLPSQVAECQAYCEDRGWPVVMEVTEDVSGATPLEQRPGLASIMERVVAGEVEAVVVHAVDRLGRERYVTIEILARLQHHGAKAFYVQGGYERDEFVETLMIGLAAKERSIIRERLMRGRETKARMGLVVGAGRIAYGYRYNGEGRLEVNEEEAAVVRQIFDWYAEEWTSIREITRRLTEWGVRTHTGKTHWSYSTVRRILGNETYAGRAYYNRLMKDPRNRVWRILRPKEEWIPVEVPAIIDPETWELVRWRLEYNQKAVRRRPHHDYLLRGMLVCAQCNYAYGGESSKGHRYYRDGGRVHPSLRAALVEERVWQAIGEVFLDPSILWASYEDRGEGARQAQDRMREQLEGVLAQLEKARAKKDELLDAYLDPDIAISKSRYLAKRTELEEEIAAWEKRAAELKGHIEQVAITEEQMASIEELTREIAQGIDDLDFAGKREVLEKLRVQGLVHHEPEGPWIELSGLFPTRRVGLMSRASIRCANPRRRPRGPV